ncbi:E3 ubiquitin ligase BIG BROTHER-related-like [Punica granatum]|uniref:RING-type domain-containing protein n=2 Tax=Punica granatum TaxID=22663 RepID=A0A218XK98_PUNGR|nr:E3 ubiquitin ligase BIG BROTHER-related-like [Punica granatum]OWM85109.1 hypothetical protein CDL15_Pgr027896 [Punica granatum]PKI57533.1 hypothetical protein CRG98_022184 [Punica granatum]
MDSNEEGKSSSRRARLDEPDPDLSLAMSLQEQEGGGGLPPLPTIVSESDEEEGIEDIEDDEDDNDDNYEYSAEDYEYFSSRGINGDFGLLEGMDSNSELFGTIEEDEIDPDNLSYEQLIELGEIIGEEKRGLSAEQVSSILQPFTYKSVERGTDLCVVCQVEYGEGEKLTALPCDHPYHPECISQWLQVKKTCPICSTEVSEPKTTRKI